MALNTYYAFILVLESRIVVSLCRTKICIVESFAIHVHIGLWSAAAAKYGSTNYGRPVREFFFQHVPNVFPALYKVSLRLEIQVIWLFFQSSGCSVIDRTKGTGGTYLRGVSGYLKLGGQVVMWPAAAAPSILPKSGWAIAHPAQPPLTPL